MNINPNKTSISDFYAYKNVCLKASQDDEVFNNFKQDSSYTEILEHASFEQGKECIHFIDNRNNLDLSKITLFKENDSQGNPTLCIYNKPWGKISSSTLRYVKVLSELIELFGSLENWKISEIGVGYGGMGLVINSYFNIEKYTFIDLPEVLELGKRYLRDFEYNNTEFKTIDQLDPNEEYDLVISNYAFSEIQRPIQMEYIKKVIRRSKHGYFTFNFISDLFAVDSMSKEEFIRKINVDGTKNFKTINEVPLTHAKNFILIW